MLWWNSLSRYVDSACWITYANVWIVTVSRENTWGWERRGRFMKATLATFGSSVGSRVHIGNNTIEGSGSTTLSTTMNIIFLALGSGSHLGGLNKQWHLNTDPSKDIAHKVHIVADGAGITPFPINGTVSEPMDLVSKGKEKAKEKTWTFFFARNRAFENRLALSHIPSQMIEGQLVT